MPATAVPPPSRRGTGGVVALALALSLGLAGCGLRVESPPPPLPSPDAADVARQAAAQRATAIALGAAAALAGTGDETLRAQLTGVVAAATAHAEALGGVWTPPEWAHAPGESETVSNGADGTEVAGDPAMSPGAAPAGTPHPDPTAVVDELTAAAALTCTDAVTVDPADLATLLASICLAQDAEARDLASVLGITEPESGAEAVVAAAETPSVGASTPVTASAESLAAVLAVTPDGLDLAASLDAAAYGLEVEAARSGGAERAVLAMRAAEQRAISQAIVAGAGAQGTSEDPRRAAYGLGPTGDPAARASAIEADLLAAWTAVIGDVAPEARPAVLAQMIDAQTGAQTGGAATGGVASPAFPGLPSPPPSLAEVEGSRS